MRSVRRVCRLKTLVIADYRWSSFDHRWLSIRNPGITYRTRYSPGTLQPENASIQRLLTTAIQRCIPVLKARSSYDLRRSPLWSLRLATLSLVRFCLVCKLCNRCISLAAYRCISLVAVLCRSLHIPCISTCHISRPLDQLPKSIFIFECNWNCMAGNASRPVYPRHILGISSPYPGSSSNKFRLKWLPRSISRVCDVVDVVRSAIHLRANCRACHACRAIVTVLLC